MRVSTWVAGTFLCLFGLAAIGQEIEAKPTAKRLAWEWTPTERLEARRLYVEALKSKGAIAQINGSETPELLMPDELFRRLIRIAFLLEGSEGREIVRTDLEFRAKMAGLSLPDGFWEKVETATQEYLNSLSETERLRARADSATLKERGRIMHDFAVAEKTRNASCAASLDRSRAAFQNSLFDKFLYAAVAPPTFVRYVSDEPEGVKSTDATSTVRNAAEFHVLAERETRCWSEFGPLLLQKGDRYQAQVGEGPAH
jgi:hypothetical protein